MSSENETVEDIVNEMREDDVRIAARETQKTEKLALSYACDWCKGYADRLESALRREKAGWIKSRDEWCHREEELKRKKDELTNALEKIYKCVDNNRGVDVSILVKSIIADALGTVAEGGAK